MNCGKNYMQAPVIAHPFVDAILEGNRIADGQDHLQWPLGLKRFVRPVSMGAGRNSHSAEPGVSVAYKVKQKRKTSQ